MAHKCNRPLSNTPSEAQNTCTLSNLVNTEYGTPTCKDNTQH